MSTENELRPRDHAEAVAHFRVKIIGELTARELSRGELADGLRRLAERKFRPPGSAVSRSYGLSTLERWYHRYRRFGLSGVTPKPRSDRGFGKALTDAERDLLLAVRRDNRHLSAKAILRALVKKGLVRKDVLSENSLRRLYRAHGIAQI